MKDTSFYSTFQMNVRGILHTFDTPIVMGILNVTPDSFYKGSRLSSESDIVDKAREMISEGAKILDVGGYSSRPGATDISINEESERVAGAIQAIREAFPEAIISIDTFRAEVAEIALAAGAGIVNDISGGQLDPEILSVTSRSNAPYIMMHMRGTPQTMKDLVEYENLTMDINQFFSEQIKKARKAGIKDIVVDPGFGFSKNIEQNFCLLKKLETFQLHGCPVLVGLSRKSMIYKTLGITPEESLAGTTALNALALSKGASILRVHDVKAAVETVKLIGATRCAE